MTEQESHNSQVRCEIQQALETLLHRPGEREEAIEALEAFENKFSEDAFSLEALVFGGIVQEALSEPAPDEPEWISALIDGLAGRTHYANAYALQYNLVRLLKDEALEAYQKLKTMLSIVAGRMGTPIKWEDESEAYKDLTESLFELCYERMSCDTIADFLVVQGCHVLFSVPDDGSECFDVREEWHGFSTIFPADLPAKLPIQPHLDYVEGILRKLEGEEVLFVDVHILPEGFVITLR